MFGDEHPQGHARSHHQCSDQMGLDWS